MGCAKLIGIETEYANAVVGYGRAGRRETDAASRLLLALASPIADDPLEACRLPGREFLVNGARAYRDHTHFEYATQEVRSAVDLVAAVRAGDAIVNRARQCAEEALPEGQQILVMANNSDGQDHAYAGHVNILMDRIAYDRLFERRPHLLYAFFIPYLVSIQVLTGAGKVGFENGTGAAPYQLSQRADFMERADPGPHTTSQRPLVNTRDEPLADPTRFARLHVIPFDTNRHEYALYLKAGTLQLVVAALETMLLEDRALFSQELTLEDPVAAIRAISRDPSLKTCVRLENGRRLTALELQQEILSGMMHYAGRTDFADAVSGAYAICEAWADTVERLEKRDEDVLVRRLDWVAKYHLVARRACKTGWGDPSLKEMDLQYANINPEVGFCHTVYERNGMADRVTTDARIAYLAEKGPEDTRAYFRSMCLRKFGDELRFEAWDELQVKLGGGWWPRFGRMVMDDPLQDIKPEIDSLFRGIHSTEELVEAFADRASHSAEDTRGSGESALSGQKSAARDHPEEWWVVS